MAKTKTPLLSLGSQGTIGNSLTTQRYGRETILRSKPTPTYRLTLPQQYQRWLYIDYLQYWLEQSNAVQQQYRTAGVRFHLTGLQYWMKYHLKNLPDFYGWWKLDVNTQPTTPDSSRNALTANILGATPATGPIAGALHFDGLNDTFIVPSNSILHNMTQLSILYYCYPTGPTGTYRYYYDNGNWSAGSGPFIRLHKTGWTHNAQFINNIGGFTNIAWPFFGGQWQASAVIWDGSNITCYRDAVLVGGPSAFTGTMVCGDGRLYLGGTIPGSRGHIMLDNMIIKNRPVSLIEIQRHSARRYQL